MNEVILRRLVRIESKLHNLASYVGVPKDKMDAGNPDPRGYDAADVTRALVRIESKLQSLMLHEGLDPYEPVRR